MRTVTEESDRVRALTRDMLDEYVAWGGKIQPSQTHQHAFYGEVLDFANFRVETVASGLDLLEQGHVADAFGLSRAVLENYLLLMLICRGTKYFLLQNCEHLTPEEFKVELKRRQDELAQAQASGGSNCLSVSAYPRAKRHIMFVYEGLMAEGEPGFKIPIHYFQFQQFQPETLRLKPEDYFEYYPPEADLKTALKKHRSDATHNYRHYLSYDGLLQCLAINDLVDAGAATRIEAHYTFLGRFLHPTHDAARDLHVRANVHDWRPTVGMPTPYSDEAVLLAHLYLAYLMASVVTEVAELHKHAPSKYITDPGCDELLHLAGQVSTRFPYFWFIYNEAPLWDKYNYALHYLTDDQIRDYGGVAKIPSNVVPFNQHILSHLSSALNGWGNARIGQYVSPLA